MNTVSHHPSSHQRIHDQPAEPDTRFGPGTGGCSPRSPSRPPAYIAHLVAGRVDSVPAAVLNGVIAGTGIGAAQWALLRHRGVSLIWIAATAVGLGAGLAAGAALVSYETDITSLA